jgi:hypothetical protein
MSTLDHCIEQTKRRCFAALFATALTGWSLPSMAQRPEHDQHWSQRNVFGDSERLSHGGYGSVLMRGGALHEDPALFVGARGGWLIGHRLLIGAGGMAQTLTVDAPVVATQEYPDIRHLEFAYGGGYFAYHLFPNEVVHPVASVLVGAGGLALSNRHFRSDSDEDSFETEANGVFVVEPELAAEINLTDFMRVQGLLSYRRVVGMNLPGMDNDDASGFNFGVAFSFGKF